MIKKILGLAAGLLFLAGCSNNDFTDNGMNNAPEGQRRSISTITATMESADTRLFFLGENKLYWDAGDKILVLSDEGDATNPQHFQATSVDLDTGVALFKGNPVYGSEFYAFYPLPSSHNWLTNVAVIPWDYTAIYYGTSSYVNTPMFAKSVNEQMEFMQLGGFVHFRIFGSGRLRELTLRGNNNEEFYSGFNLYYASDHSLALEPNPSEGVSSYITDNFVKKSDNDAPVLSESNPFDVFYALPANMTFENGFTISGVFLNEDDQLKSFSMKTEKEFTVKRAEVSHFRDIEIGRYGDVEVRGWKTNFCDLSGLEVEVTPYRDGDKVAWNLTFLTDDKGDPVIVTFKTDYTSGVPTLDNLDGLKLTGAEVVASDLRFHDFENNLIYRVKESGQLNINKDENGIWSLEVKGMTLYENNEVGPDQEGIYLKFNGIFDFIPLPTWNFSGAALMSGAYTSATMDVAGHTVNYQIRFSTMPFPKITPYSSFQEVMIKFGYVFEGDTPSFPTKATIDDFYLDIFSQSYYWGGVYVKVDEDAVMTIYQNDDGAYEINITGMKMYRATSSEDWSPNMATEPEISNFSFVGELEFDSGDVGGLD